MLSGIWETLDSISTCGSNNSMRDRRPSVYHKRTPTRSARNRFGTPSKLELRHGFGHIPDSVWSLFVSKSASFRIAWFGVVHQFPIAPLPYFAVLVRVDWRSAIIESRGQHQSHCESSSVEWEDYSWSAHEFSPKKKHPDVMLPPIAATLSNSY
ncbi:unnamed protein product, partial [Nesidiocoris tenuis]